MSYKIDEIEGIAKTNKAKLKKAGISTTAGLLKLCCDRKGRNAVAKTTGVDAKKLLQWANMADLMRITGIGRQYAELLEKAGVDTVKELSKRRADNLADTMAKKNASGKNKISGVAPSQKRVEGWVAQAKALKPIITH